MHFYEQKFAYLIFLLYLCLAKVLQNQLLTNKFKIMKKILTLFTALILFGSMTVVQADITIRAKVPAEWTNSISVYLYGTDDNGFHAATQDGDWWSYTYSGSSSSINAIYVNGSDWGGNSNQTNDITSISADACYQITYNSSGKCNFATAACPGEDSFTFPAGTTIYYQLTGSDDTSTDKGYNIYNAAGTEYGAWKNNTQLADIIPVTLTADLTLTANSNLFKSDRSGWAGVKCTTFPTEGQNMIVSTNGSTYTWDTYVPPTPNDYTIYFKNTPGWDNVYIHLYPSGQTFGENGVGGNSADVNAQMTKIDAGPFFKYEFSSSTEYSKVCFTKEAQNNYDNFWTNECSWSDGLNFANDLVLWIPNTASSSSKNNCTYYNTGDWSVYPPVVPGVSFSGLPTSVYKGQTVTFAATSENVANPTYTFYVKQGEEEYGSAVTEYTFNDAGTYRVKVEVRANGVGESLVDAEQIITCTKYSLMQNNHSSSDKGSEVTVFSSNDGVTFTATWNCASAGAYYFYASTNTSADAHANCDYLNGNQTFVDGSAIQIYLYGDATNCYNHSFTLNAPRAGEYTFTLTLGGTNNFKCDFPEALAAEVSFNAFPALMYKGITIDLTACVSSENVTNPSYTFFVTPEGGSESEIVDPVHFSPAAGSYTLKVEVREAGESGAALDTKTTNIEIKTLYLMQTDGSGKGSQVEECATTDGVHFTASWTCSSSADVYFYVTNNPAADAHSSCDYLSGGTFTDGTGINAWLYGISNYGQAYKLASPWDGEYEFTLTLNPTEPHSFKCDFPAEPAPVYTVAGSESAFGSNWNVNDAANEMILDGGVYKLTKTDRELLAGNIEFKVVKDHDYAKGEWPASNYQLAIPENGKYTIDITFDPANVGNEISAVATKTGEIVVIPTIKIDGSWDWGNETTLTGDETSVSTTIHLDAGTHYFKMLVNGDHRSNGYYYHRGYTGAAGITENKTDMSLGADIAGDYTFTWTFETNGIEITFPLTPIAPIGGKFTINAKGDTAIFARGNLQYQQSSNTWRCAPNQYEWKGTDNLQMGNSAYEGWVDLFCWSIGSENNYGATSDYLTTTYFNKSFVDWGGLFSDTYEWSTLSINEWNYLLYSRANANNLWGMAMIGNNLGMIILPDEWTAPSGVTFVPGTIPTTDLFADEDCLDPTMADQDHWRLNPDNLPANKFTVADWEILEAAGAVFLPYGGRRSGGYGNHTNRQDQTIDEEYAYAYYENYYGSYWTSTVRYPEQGKAYWLPLICGGCNDTNENWGRGSHGWWENGRYGHSVRLVTRIPKAEYETVRTGLTQGNYYTVCLPKQVTAVKGATFWSLTYKETDDSKVYIEEENVPFIAGTPFIIQATADKLEVMYTGDATGTPVENGALRGTLVDINASDFALLDGDVYILKDNKIRQRTTGNFLSANRAYILYNELQPVPAAGFAPGKNVRGLPLQKDEAQGFENLEGGEKPIKVLIDGQLYIIRGENVYNANGQIVQ